MTNPHALKETRRNIEKKKSDLLSEFKKVLENVNISNAFYPSLKADLPLQDKPVLAGAIGSRCTHLLTTDLKYFGKLFGKCDSWGVGGNACYAC